MSSTLSRSGTPGASSTPGGGGTAPRPNQPPQPPPPVSQPQPQRPSLGQRLVAWVRELVQFGLVGASAFVIDVGLFNLLQHGPLGVLAGHPNTANAVAAAVATTYSWVANRLWTYRGRTRESTAHEALLFAFANIGGVLITQFCLLFTHHILGLTSPLADNVAAYVVGFGLGTAFRFVFYHYVVFTGSTDRPATEGTLVSATLGGVPREGAPGPQRPEEGAPAQDGREGRPVPQRTATTRRQR